MPVRQRALDHRRMTLHRHGDSEQRQRHPAVTEQIKKPPDAGARTIFIDRFHRHVPRTLEWRGADDFGQEHLRGGVTMKDGVFRSLFIIQHKLNSDPRLVRPARMRRRVAIANQVARIAHPDSPAVGVPPLRSICRHFASIARSSGSIQMTLPGGMACEAAACQ